MSEFVQFWLAKEAVEFGIAAGLIFVLLLLIAAIAVIKGAYK